MLTPSRLSIARKRRGLTKKALAKSIGVNPHSILRYESGKTTPDPEVVGRIASVLNFPVDFFYGDDVPELDATYASFRSLASMSASERDSALAAGQIASIFLDWVHENFKLPSVDLEDLVTEQPEVAAREIREEWGLGERPIKNVIRLMESKGIRVFSLAEETQRVDAYAVWISGVPCVFLNSQKSAERSRFDAAHELGHLLLHRHGAPNGQVAEQEADEFASAFLMPASDVLAVASSIRTIEHALKAKRRWGVSVFALIRRLHKLQILSDWQYRTFCIQASERGYRKQEPEPMDREFSSVWRMVLTELWKERITKTNIARILKLPPDEIESLLFAAGKLPPLPGGEDRVLELVL